MVRAHIQYDEQGQTVRLPGSVAFPDGIEWVEIMVNGRSLLISPEKNFYEWWFFGRSVADDFMPERKQPEMQHRDHGI